MEVPKTIDKSLALPLATALVLFGVAWRLTPHIPNFAPIGAIALIAGQTLGWKKSLLVLLATMSLSDYGIGAYSSMPWTWLAFGLIAAFGLITKKMPLSWRVPVSALGASILFFIVSNFGTWIASGMYSLDLAGLIRCYIMAIPFFKATLLSDLMFGALFIGSYETAAWLYREWTASTKRQPDDRPVAA